MKLKTAAYYWIEGKRNVRALYTGAAADAWPYGGGQVAVSSSLYPYRDSDTALEFIRMTVSSRRYRGLHLEYIQDVGSRGNILTLVLIAKTQGTWRSYDYQS
jgi:hypothetical protein